MKTGIKLRVTPEQSEAVQKICFANGYTWKHNPNNIKLVGIGYHFLGLRSSDNTLWATGSNSCFTDWESEEVDADLFIRTNGTCEESINIVDNSSNNKSREDIFNQYGFEVPDFDCTILAKVNNDYIGYVTTPGSTIVALSWALSGTSYIGVTYTPDYCLIPIKEPWYKNCNFPVLVWSEDNELVTLHTISNFTTSMLNTFKPLSNDEIDQLKQDF